MLAVEEWGVLSLDELAACGLSRKAVQRRARRGWLHRLHRGVYAVGHPNPPLEGLWLAAVKACGPWAWLSHYSASAHWEYVEWDDRAIEVCVPAPGARLRPGLRVHRTEALDPRDFMRHRGIPVTSPARTLLDLAAVVRPPQLRTAVRRALSLRRVGLRQLAEVSARLPHRRGAAALARIIAEGPEPTRSELEDVVLDLILDAGFERPEVNTPLRLDGRLVIPDFRWPTQRLIVEADSRTWHDNRIAREDDAERQALLEAHGERLVRVTWHQATSQRAETIARLEAAGAPRTSS